MTLDPNAPEITTLQNSDLLEVYSEKQLKRINAGNLKIAMGVNPDDVYNGIVGDGIYDNTTVLQNLINSLPDYSTILLPHGVIKFSSLNLGSKNFTFVGRGSFLNRSAVAGSSAWDNNNDVFGTVLRSTLESGIVINATNGKVNLRDLALIGKNGLTTGVKCGVVTNPYRVLLRWSNVQFANFATGALIDNVYENHFEAVNFRGCTKGFHLLGANVSTLTACSVSVCETGIHLDGTANTIILGGAVQGVTDVGILIDDSEEVTIQNVYFENVNANYAIDQSGISDRTILVNNHTGTFSDKVRINSNHCIVYHGKYTTESGVSNLIIAGNGNRIFVPSNHTTITNTGAGNIISRLDLANEVITGSTNSEVVFNTVYPVVKSPNGTLYRLIVDNSGNLSTQVT